MPEVIPTPIPATQEGKILGLVKRREGASSHDLARYSLKYTSIISTLRKRGHNIVAVRQTKEWRYYCNE